LHTNALHRIWKDRVCHAPCLKFQSVRLLESMVEDTDTVRLGGVSGLGLREG
jgi:hypothetical protein